MPSHPANILIPFFNKESKADGRYITLLILALYFLTIFISSFYTNYYEFWKYLGVPAHSQRLFFDLFTVIRSTECHHLGYDVYNNNSCYEYFFAYPKIWFLSYYLGIRSQHTLIIGFLLIIIFYFLILKLSGRLNIFQGVYYGFLLCSPPMMLCVERCNPDIIIFILLLISALLVENKISNRYSYCLILLASFLKLYPFIAIAAFFNNDKRSSLKIFFILLFISIIYILINLNDILIFSNKAYLDYFEGAWVNCFGALALVDYIKQLSFLNHINIFIPWHLIPYLSIIVIVFICIVLYNKKKQNYSNFTTSIGFKIGALLYLGIFILGKSYDYKLIVFTMIIPQLFNWVKTKEQIQNTAMLVLILILISCWSSLGLYYPDFIEPRYRYFVMTFTEEIINWFVFGFLVFVLLCSLPDWAKTMIETSKSFSLLKEK